MIKMLSSLLLVCIPVIAFSAPTPSPPPEFDQAWAGQTIETPIEGAFWLPILNIQFVGYQSEGDQALVDGITVEVSKAEESIPGALYVYPGNQRMFFWKADQALEPGLYTVSMRIDDDLYGAEESSMQFEINVAMSNSDPTETSVSLEMTQLIEIQKDDDVICCNTMDDLNECFRGCPVHCWAESYSYPTEFKGSSTFEAVDRYESFTHFKLVIRDQSNYRSIGFADQLTSPVESQIDLPVTDERCYAFKWVNAVTQDEGQTDWLCFSRDEVNVIDHIPPTPESLNQEAAMCFEMPEDYPKEEANPPPKEEANPPPESDMNLAEDEEGCQQAPSSSFWIFSLLMMCLGRPFFTRSKQV
jgi:hypothetical protein